MDFFDSIDRCGIIPVAIIRRVDDARPLAGALSSGGLPLIEVTLRSDAALGAIRAIAGSATRILLGAGTVLTVDQARSALDAGAQFIVAPGLNRSVVEFCLGQGIPVLPGVVTPTEIGAALEMGLQTLKFFPAHASGGVEYLRAVSAPFSSVKFIPTGGIDEANLASYLKLPCVRAVGGSWLATKDLLAQRRFDEISAICARSVLAVAEIVKQKNALLASS